MADSEAKTETSGSKPRNPLWLASLGFLIAALWILGSACYSRRAIAPALKSMADNPAQWDDARRLMKRATWLVFGGALFAQKLNHDEVPESLSSETLEDMATDFRAMLDTERKTAERLVMIPDPLAASKYGPACVQYVNGLKTQRAEGQGPSDSEALGEIMGYVDYYVTAALAHRYGERATAILMEFRQLEKDNHLTKKKRNDLDAKWKQAVAKDIIDFQQLVLINGRNGYVFGGFLFLASMVFLLVSLFGRHTVLQDRLLA